MRRLTPFIATFAMALAAMVVAPATATPPSIIGLTQLRTMLQSSPNGIDGYFLTVPGGPSLAQQSPVPVKMKVLAVADKSGPDGALIMFRADMTDPVMQKVGGIAAGMSGSPLFIDDGGTARMIGALSYGYSFTLDGLGLATPIEYMLATQGEFPPVTNAALALDRPVDVDGRTIRAVRVTTKRTASEASGTLTFRSLFVVNATGVPQGSAVYKRLAKVAASKGARLMPGGNGQCTQTGFSAPYEQGGSVGAYYTMGSAEIGGYGTVTYVDGNSVMGFGHPMDWAGKTDIFATNAWISGIWGSAEEPFKVGCAGQRRGSLTQDRSAAIGIDLNATTAATPATSDVRITTDMTRSGTAATDIAAGTFTAGFGPVATEMAVTEPVYRVANQSAMAGSARTTTVVNVTDGTSSYTITRPDIWSGTDVLGLTGADAAGMVSTLTSTPGIPARITSVHLDADVDQNSRAAMIVGVTGGPLQVGVNTVSVLIKPVGGSRVSVPATFTVPAGLSLDTGLAVEAGTLTAGGGSGEETDTSSSGEPVFDSLGAIVDWLTKLPQNNQIVFSVPDANGNMVEVGRVGTDYFLDGAVYPSAVSGQLVADVEQAQIGDEVNLMAMPSGVPGGAPITLSQRSGSGAWQPVATAALGLTSDGMMAASFTVTATANTTYRASWPGDGNFLAWSASAEVSVAPPLMIDGLRKGKRWAMTVSSVPQAAGVPVSVQAKRNGAWKSVANAVLAADGSASLTWKTGPASVKVRAVSTATSQFAAATSSPLGLSSANLLLNPDAKPTSTGNVTIALRTPKGKPITGVTYRVQHRTDDGWEPAARSTLRRTSRVWLANGDYRVTVPKQKSVAAVIRQPLTVSSAAIVIGKVSGGSRARVNALPPIPLRFTVQKLQAGQWLPVGGVRRMQPPKMRWSRELGAGRYRFAFPKQSGFSGATSKPVRVRG